MIVLLNPACRWHIVQYEQVTKILSILKFDNQGAILQSVPLTKALVKMWSWSLGAYAALKSYIVSYVM